MVMTGFFQLKQEDATDIPAASHSGKPTITIPSTEWTYSVSSTPTESRSTPAAGNKRLVLRPDLCSVKKALATEEPSSVISHVPSSEAVTEPACQDSPAGSKRRSKLKEFQVNYFKGNVDRLS